MKLTPTKPQPPQTITKFESLIEIQNQQKVMEELEYAYNKALGSLIKIHHHSGKEIICEYQLSLLERVSKEITRAQKRYHATLKMQRQMSAPSLQVSIKAKNAYVAQNQLNQALIANDQH